MKPVRVVQQPYHYFKLWYVHDRVLYDIMA